MCTNWEDAFIFSVNGNENIQNILGVIEPMNPFGGEISGKVYSSSSSSISGSLISAVDSLGTIISSTISVYDGNYLIPFLKSGNYKIKASKIGYYTSEYFQPVRINLINNPVVDGINIAIIATDVGEDKNMNPGFFKLSQNYPNPFNPITKIRYQVPFAKSGYIPLVQLKVYDILGREVSTLVNEEKPAGTYIVNFDASNLSSGIYFYSILADSYHQTKKMILAK